MCSNVSTASCGAHEVSVAAFEDIGVVVKTEHAHEMHLRIGCQLVDRVVACVVLLLVQCRKVAYKRRVGKSA